MTHTWKVLATVLRVIDGDTFSADLDLGWGMWRREVKGAPSRIRILGYYAPERNQEGYQEAKDALAAAIPIGTQVWIESHALDSFGRALCDCHIAAGNQPNLLDLLPQQWRVKPT